MPAVEAARERFVLGCKDAWDAYSRDHALVKKPKKPKRPKTFGPPPRWIGGPVHGEAVYSFSPASGKWAHLYHLTTAPARETYQDRLQAVRDTLLADMRAALPGIEIPTFEEAARRSRYWEMEPV